jgi:hypothetical protein
MQYHATVLEKVTEFIKEDKMFTSVDVANAVKSEGLWVRNREVRDWLLENFSDKNLFGDYAISQIYVCNGSSVASLYHPALSDPNDYLERNQQPLTPDEVKAIALKKVGTVKDSMAPDLNKMLPDTFDDDDDDDHGVVVDMTITIRSKDRIKIPGAMIRAIGWVPGQIVDPALILTTNTISGSLVVNDDYRVSIPRSAVPWGTDPVNVILKGGKIKFEKA